VPGAARVQPGGAGGEGGPAAAGAAVDTVIVGGKVLVRDGRPLYLDPTAIRLAAQASAERLLRSSKLITPA
jgi:hypothetical protein